MLAPPNPNKWKNHLLSNYVRSKIINENWIAPRTFMETLPAFWTIELTRNGALEDTFDADEGLFSALPPLQDTMLPPNKNNNGGYDAEDRELVRRLLNDVDFFESERGGRLFTQLILNQLLLGSSNNNNNQEEEQQKSISNIIVRDCIYIGKDQANLIKLENPSVSRIHAVMFLGVEKSAIDAPETVSCYVVDMQSSNGTFVLLPKTTATSQTEFKKLEPWVMHKLQDGDSIRCATSSVLITTHCTPWKIRMGGTLTTTSTISQQQNNTNKKQQQPQDMKTALQKESGVFRQRDQMMMTSEQIEERNAKFAASLVQQQHDATDPRSIAAVRIQNLRNLSVDALQARKMQIVMEIARAKHIIVVDAAAGDHRNHVQSMQSDLRDIEYVLSEKTQQQLFGGNTNNTTTTTTTTVVIEEM
jgi:hypothetical protein